MAKGDKVQTDSSPQTTSDYDSDNEDDENYANNLIKKYGKAAATKILKLIYANDKLESCIESQGELLLEEREKNQGLEVCLSKEKERVEKLGVELSLVKDSNERLTKEHSSLNGSLASLKNDHSLAQESLTSLTTKYHELELNYEKLWSSTSTASKDSKASTSKSCERCINVDINACLTNLDELAKKDKEIQRLNTIVKIGCKCKDKQPVNVFKASRHPIIKDGLGYNRYNGKANGRNMINGVACVKFNKSVPLVDLIDKVNNVATPTIPLANNKNIKKKQGEMPKQQAPISRNHICDYMCCWDKDGKIVVKYVGALKKRQILRSVWVPKSYVSNPLGSNSGPKTKA
jgi:predicted nuclease with TOPRIM domain